MTAALEKTYDGIVIGAGHHGLVLGSYLAKQGLDILLVDRRLHYGGGLSTQEATLPGFHHNLHSINHFHITETPWFKDLDLGERVTYITPRYELGQPHLDGTALVFGRDLEETLANVARFSKKDARDLPRMELQGRGDHPAHLPARAIRRAACRRPSARRCCRGARSVASFSTICKRQPFDVVKELFENEHVQLLFLFKVSLFGTWLVDTLSKTSPMGSVIRAFDLQSGYQLCQGGSFNLARGLMETFIARGRPLPAAGRDRAHPGRGRQGDRHRADRRPHGARPAVRRETHRRAPDLREPDRPRAASGGVPEEDRRLPIHQWSLFGLHLALDRAGAAHAEAFDPNIHRTLKWSLGAETMEDLMAAHKDVMAGKRAADRAVRRGAAQRASIRPRRRPASTRNTPGTSCRSIPTSASRSYEDFKRGVRRPDRREVFARYAPNMTKQEHSSAGTSTPRANTSRSFRRCEAATFSWARSTPSR